MKLIVELFNADLDSIISQVSTAKYVGASWLLIPPQQEHLNYDNEWWSSYKPLGYKISNDTKDKLEVLVKLCSSQGIKIMVDTVLNHSDPNSYKDKSGLFHPSNPDEKEIQRQWIFGLPDWNSSHPTVKENGKQLMETYRSIGIKGFRFDAAAFIDHDFFDYILKNSPEDELHLYEVYGFDNKFVTAFLKRRLEFRRDNTLLYDFQEYFNSNALINKKEVYNTYDSFYYDTILPQYGVSMVTNHDQMLHNWNIKPIDMLVAGVLTAFMSCHDYLLTTVCVSSTVPVCGLWSWETVENYFLPILKLKEKYGSIPAAIQTDEEGNILTAVVKGKMFFAFNRNYTSDVSKIPVNYFSKEFIGFKKQDLLVNIFNNQEFKGTHIPVPERNIVIGDSENMPSKSNNLIHMIWYQGWDAVPDYGRRSVDLWGKIGQVMLWDKESIFQLDLSDKERTLLDMVEERFPKPEMYAAYSDIARLIILSRYGGIYVDTDSYPNRTTGILLDWLDNSESLIVGREPSGMVNNAVIVCPIESMSTVKSILDKIISEIMREWDENILNFAGPQRLKTVLYQEKWVDYVILPGSWLYATWNATKDGVGESCTKELVLVQHCYAGSWVSDWNSKYIKDYFNYKAHKPSQENFMILTRSSRWLYVVIGILLIGFLSYKCLKKKKSSRK